MGTVYVWLTLALLYLVHITEGRHTGCERDTSLDGTLMRYPGHYAVYQIIDGCKHRVPRIRTYENLYKDTNCIKTDTSIRNLCKCHSLSIYATLIKGSGPAVYLLSNGVKRHIANPDTFNAFCFDWDKIKTISDFAVKRIFTGSSIKIMTAVP
ncbi:uncharacterized protein LOC143240399 [Tachypleus tridentatus]|uniref:uncharacterized protein LOC143240399 n=1 Tax=Tachypleus tridentatus TaxID=6853 RepID=UPI003FD0E337